MDHLHLVGDDASEGHHVAAGGMRRAVLGTLAGLALGLLARAALAPAPPGDRPGGAR